MLPRALVQAIDFFASWLADPSVSRAGLDGSFRRIGLVQARSGQALDALRGGYQLATSAVWRRLRTAAAELGVPASALGEWAAAALEFLDSLIEQSLLGYRQATESSSREQERLLDTILRPDRHPAWLLGQLAAATGWRVPQQVVAVAVRPAPGLALPGAARLPAGALPDLRRRPAMLLLPRRWTPWHGRGWPRRSPAIPSRSAARSGWSTPRRRCAGPRAAWNWPTSA